MRATVCVIVILLVGPTAGTEAIAAQKAPEARAPYSVSGATTVTLAPRPDVAYRLYVAVPPDYAAVTTTYPVVYLADGDWYFALGVTIARLLEAAGELPPMIIVGIGYGGTVTSQRQRRWRDFTPAAEKTLPNSGHAGAFLGDLRDAIIPYVESQYRVSGDRAFVGHSLGGLFGLHVMMREPRLFGRTVIGDPALWPAGGAFWAEEEAFRRTSTFRGRMFVALSDLDGRRDPGEIQKLSKMLGSHASADFAWVTRTLPDTSHQSSVAALLAAGLRWVFPKP
ncbi:MAG TPA: alpha/beta hydrolase-fold protein [Vicinamibacterales bacterium]|nr:alpha/beta hydrolase-fold protein [Vicinamibacterales bacterium]